jgi:hypothetical protein
LAIRQNEQEKCGYIFWGIACVVVGSQFNYLNFVREVSYHQAPTTAWGTDPTSSGASPQVQADGWVPLLRFLFEGAYTAMTGVHKKVGNIEKKGFAIAARMLILP